MTEMQEIRQVIKTMTRKDILGFLSCCAPMGFALFIVANHLFHRKKEKKRILK
jgi:hypothetical protein